MYYQYPLHLTKCLNRISEKYSLSPKEINLIKKIGNHVITSISFTTDGGFDKNNGEFHYEERKTNYKVRIRYRNVNSGEEKLLVLIPFS